MKKGMRMISGLLVITLMSSAACGGVRVPIRSAAGLSSVKPDDAFERAYRVTFASGESINVKDEDLIVYQTGIGVRFEGEKQFRFYSSEHIREVKRRVKRRVGMGALIGLGAGAAVGVGGAIAASKSSCAGADDVGDCKLMRNAGAVIIGVAAPLFGTILGLAIGGAIRKKKKQQKVSVSVAPQLYGRDGVNVEGAGLGISGTF